MPDRGAQGGSEQQESVDMGCGSHEGSNTEATHSKCCRRTRPSKVNTYASMVFRVIECCTYHYQSSNSGMASKEKIVAFGRPADSKDLGFIGDHVSRQRKGLLRPTACLDNGTCGLQPRERGEREPRETAMQSKTFWLCGYEPVSRGACCGSSVKVDCSLRCSGRLGHGM